MSSNTNRSNRRRQGQDRRLRVRTIRRQPLDYRKLAGALIELAMAQAEAEAEAEDEHKRAARQRRAERQADTNEVDHGEGEG